MKDMSFISEQGMVIVRFPVFVFFMVENDNLY